MGPPVQYPSAPLTRWQSAWRYLLAVGIGGGCWLVVAGEQWRYARVLFWTDLTLGVLSLLAMRYRRRWPFGVTTAVASAGALSASSIGPWSVCQVSLATRRRWREIAPTAVIAVVNALVYNALLPKPTLPWYTTLVFCLLSVGVVVAVGLYVGARRDLVASLRDRAERAEHEQALVLAAARAGERTRIAREMHDVLAHRMSLVAMHAGVLAYRGDLTVEQTRATADIIQTNSQRALSDLREILGLLRDTERGLGGTDHRPQPTLGDLESLLADERAAGASVTLRSELDELAAVPDSIGRSAYRIVEEGLTNARKHAPNAIVTVELSGHAGDGLAVQVRNPLRTGGNRNGDQPAGFGLVGLAERAAANHGRFEHGPTADGDFVLRAWLPWQR